MGPDPAPVIPTNDGNLPADSQFLCDRLPRRLAVPDDLPREVAARLARGAQALMRGYQGRFIVLPTLHFEGSIVATMQAHYAPQVAKLGASGQTAARYVKAMLTRIHAGDGNPFLRWLDPCPDRAHHYRNFLIQSGTDLLAEASASALGIIDEFGCGVHDKKHSVLFRTTLAGFDLPTDYNACWPLFDTAALALHNTIHYLFQSPRNFFRQIGFLLYAETSYQRSTGDHDRYLRKHHPGVDATYFSEHAHIDIHHSSMVATKVVTPLVARFGEEVGQEFILGTELTRTAFATADHHRLALCQAFHAAVLAGDATYGMPAQIGIGRGIKFPEDGLSPKQIADDPGVGMSTLNTWITAHRGRCGGGRGSQACA